jgi:hypothetical protein
MEHSISCLLLETAMTWRGSYEFSNDGAQSTDGDLGSDLDGEHLVRRTVDGRGSESPKGSAV